MLPSVIEEATCIHNRTHVSQALDGVCLACGFDMHLTGIQVHANHIACFEDFTESFLGFTGIKLARGHSVAEENTGKTLSQN